jgi:iron(III) transport system permease protein
VTPPLRPEDRRGARVVGWRTRTLALFVLALLAWLVGYPLLITGREALGSGPELTLRYFAEFFSRPDELHALWRTTWVTVVSVVLAALLGVPLGFLFERTEFPGRRVLGALIALPVALPPLVGVVAFLFLYGERGVLARLLQGAGLVHVRWSFTGPWAILIVHAYSMYVYFYLFVRAGLARLDASLLEAASSLGAGRWLLLRRVVFPHLRPALAGASLLVFMTALASFSAPYIFGGGFRVMTTQIVASKLNGEVEMARVETVMLGVLALLGLLLLRRIDPGVTLTGGERGVAPERARLRRPGARFWAGLAGFGLGLFVLLPHLTLILMSLVPATKQLDHRSAAAGARSRQLPHALLRGRAAAPGAQFALDGGVVDRGGASARGLGRALVAALPGGAR